MLPNLHGHGGFEPVRYECRPLPRRLQAAVNNGGPATAAAITAAAATAIAATTTATAAAATTTTAAAVATTPAAATLFTRPGFVHRQAPAVVLLIVKPLDRCLRLCLGVHLDKAETLAPARRAILNHLRTLHGAELREQLLQRESLTP